MVHAHCWLHPMTAHAVSDKFLALSSLLCKANRMTDESAPQAGGPRELLASVRDLTRQVRAAQRGTWFPLLVFAALSFGAIPVAQHGGHTFGNCSAALGPAEQPRPCKVYSVGPLVYWSVGLVLAYAAIAGFYRYQARRRGIGTRVKAYVLVGVVVAVLATAVTLWSVYHPSGGGSTLSQVVNQLHTPSAAIGMALLALAWVERNPALAWFSLGYLIVVLIPATYLTGDHPTLASPVPRQLIIAGVLLLGSLAFAITRRAVPREPQ